MCSSVFSRPNEKRTDERASAGLCPMASKTCDGVLSAELHAAPVDAARPIMSRLMTMASPSSPAKAMFDVFGNRWAPPFTRVPLMLARIFFSK